MLVKLLVYFRFYYKTLEQGVTDMRARWKAKGRGYTNFDPLFLGKRVILVTYRRNFELISMLETKG